MRLLAFAGFALLLGLIGYLRGREVTWREQCAWVGGIFLAGIVMNVFDLW